MNSGDYKRKLDDHRLAIRVKICLGLTAFLRWRLLPSALLWVLGVLLMVSGVSVGVVAGTYLGAIIALMVGLLYPTTPRRVCGDKLKEFERNEQPLKVIPEDFKRNIRDKKLDRKLNFKCLQCGTCCKGYVVRVPVSNTSDLSPEYLTVYLREYGFWKLLKYVIGHSEFMTNPCRWLDFDINGKAICHCYPRRSYHCSNYTPFSRLYSECPVGKKALEKSNSITESKIK